MITLWFTSTFITILFIITREYAVLCDNDSLNNLWKSLQTRKFTQEKREPRHVPFSHLTALLESLDPDPDVISSDSDSLESPGMNFIHSSLHGNTNLINPNYQFVGNPGYQSGGNFNSIQNENLNTKPSLNFNSQNNPDLHKQEGRTFNLQKSSKKVSIPLYNDNNKYLNIQVKTYPSTPENGIGPNSNPRWFLNQPKEASKRTNNENKKKMNSYPTTKHLRELFIGRCYELQFIRQIEEGKEYDCINLWKLFIQAFAYKPPCDVTLEDYKPFLSRLKEEIPVNQGLLWSGTRELAHKYSDLLYSKRYTTLEDTMAGYLTTGLTWCGKKDDPGMNFESCPWKCSIQEPFWAMANKQFAQSLRGIVHIILNGTRQHLQDKKIYPSYMKDRYYLGPYILPELKAETISKIVVIVMHTLHLKPLERCGELSVQMLINDISKKGIPVECQDDTDDLKDILCVDDAESLECANLQKRQNVESSKEIIRQDVELSKPTFNRNVELSKETLEKSRLMIKRGSV